jgi:hypothetical protein
LEGRERTQRFTTGGKRLTRTEWHPLDCTRWGNAETLALLLHKGYVQVSLKSENTASGQTAYWCTTSLTPEGRRQGQISERRDWANQPVYEFKLGQRKLIGITGISELPMAAGTQVDLEYEWIPNDLAKEGMRMAVHDVMDWPWGKRKGEAHFRRYDDG